MPQLCEYLNCHNLGSSTYQGYCNQNHLERSKELEPLFKIIKENKEISTLGQARLFLTSSQKSKAELPFQAPPKRESVSTPQSTQLEKDPVS